MPCSFQNNNSYCFIFCFREAGYHLSMSSSKWPAQETIADVARELSRFDPDRFPLQLYAWPRQLY